MLHLSWAVSRIQTKQSSFQHFSEETCAPFATLQWMPMLWKTQPMYQQSFMSQYSVEKKEVIVMEHRTWNMQLLKPDIDLPNLQSLISTIRSGNALALTGAGFSLLANLLSWSDLLQALLEKAKVTSKIDKAQYNFIQGLVSAGTAKSYDQAAQVSTCFNMKMLFTQAQLTRVSFEHSWTKESWRFPRKRVNASWDVKVASHWLFVDVTSHAAVSNVLCCVLSIFNCTNTFRKISIFCGIRHIKIFNDIPWKAALTTNYDIFASGPTPQCSDVG